MSNYNNQDAYSHNIDDMQTQPSLIYEDKLSQNYPYVQGAGTLNSVNEFLPSLEKGARKRVFNEFSETSRTGIMVVGGSCVLAHLTPHVVILYLSGCNQ